MCRFFVKISQGFPETTRQVTHSFKVYSLYQCAYSRHIYAFQILRFFCCRWNHTPHDEAMSNGHKKVAELLLEGIRQWDDEEERKIKEEFVSEDDEFVTNENSIASGDAEPPLSEISKKL